MDEKVAYVRHTKICMRIQGGFTVVLNEYFWWGSLVLRLGGAQV